MLRGSGTCMSPKIAYILLPDGTPKHVLRELESDLLGWHFFLTGWAPVEQYRKVKELTLETAEARAE